MERYLSDLLCDPNLKLEGDNVGEIHGARKIFRLVWDFDGMARYGILWRYFEENSGFLMLKCLQALRILGLNKHADLLREALALVCSKDYIDFLVPWDDYGDKVKNTLLLEFETQQKLSELNFAYEDLPDTVVPALFEFVVSQGSLFYNLNSKTYKNFHPYVSE